MTDQFKIGPFVRNHGAAIARFATKSHPTPEHLNVTEISETPNCLSFRIECPENPVVVVAWNTIKPETARSFNRELACLKLMNKTGLTPRLLGHSNEKRLLIREDMKGQSFNNILSAENCAALAHSLGEWFYRFHEEMPRQETDNTCLIT